MKLMIKKKYFDEIKAGDKTVDFRDSHITFVCEETGETLRKEVIGVSSQPVIKDKSGYYVNYLQYSSKQGVFTKRCYLDKSLFEDDRVIAFRLEEEDK